MTQGQKGIVHTIDAMGCQYAIANKILKKKGEYIFSLKGNQGALNNDVMEYFLDKDILKNVAFYEDWNKGHGRIESRRFFFVENNTEWLREKHVQWRSISSIIRIDSTRQIKDTITKETRYYISSLNETLATILRKIRSHWAIENSLHWVLDMSFGDDQSRIRKENAPQAMAVIRHIAFKIVIVEIKSDI